MNILENNVHCNSMSLSVQKSNNLSKLKIFSSVNGRSE